MSERKCQARTVTAARRFIHRTPRKTQRGDCSDISQRRRRSCGTVRILKNIQKIKRSNIMAQKSDRVDNLVNMIDAYVEDGGHHLNVNVFNRDTLLDAQAHPEKYPQLTVRVSGYAVNFNKLTKEQQDDVISRTIHESL
ncbi:MAG TPA: autonomous glycyl radical cofactor GrcA [Candidatus Coproplasma stercoravium]|nr:autonomous glycyl radical cofactor GrcA [Candidatus Coproplasma stercoravium]